MIGAVRAMSSRISVLNQHTFNPHIVAAEYAVRGPLVIRANELKAELQRPDHQVWLSSPCFVLTAFLLRPGTTIESGEMTPC